MCDRQGGLSRGLGGWWQQIHSGLHDELWASRISLLLGLSCGVYGRMGIENSDLFFFIYQQELGLFMQKNESRL